MPMSQAPKETASGGARVCMVVHAHYPEDPRVSREALAARDAGHAVSVLCLRAPGEPAREVVDGVEVERLALPIADRSRSALAAFLIEYVGFALKASLRLARRLLTRPRLDVVYVNTPPDFLAVVGLVPRLLRRKVVIDIHDSSPLLFGERFGGRGARLAQWVLGRIERGACALAHEVVTVHEGYVELLARNAVPRRKITTVMNSPDARRVERVRVAADRERAGGEPTTDRAEDFVVAYHGTIDLWYGVPLIVEALAEASSELGEWRALVLGDGDALPGTRERARELGLSDRIEFSGGFLPAEEALRRVALADCGVIPNLPSPLNRFTLSTKLLEYVALGVPAVVARLESLAAHFEEDEVTFFRAGDPGALAEALVWVARHPTEAAEKSERALRRYRDYDWATSRDRLLGVLDGRSPGAPAARTVSADDPVVAGHAAATAPATPVGS